MQLPERGDRRGHPIADLRRVGRVGVIIAGHNEEDSVELPSTKGGTEKIAAYRGKKNVVLAFYPKAFTGG